ncbi:hypothetical protein K458DRAFT_476462 [Lentithecium fluviatile CBS 122367]|uniref:Uncharacterized protein n=1 Tax=Lentithecium fluviatile CBS 122367 TaxID=1168545 RepID=A0A6G1J950_9PLEO|nr:hypothetical protein K458DRAFT_476462 [Lentithecium fluviatile CBS 122367]
MDKSTQIMAPRPKGVEYGAEQHFSMLPRDEKERDKSISDLDDPSSKKSRKTTLRKKFQFFPWKVTLVIATLPLALALIISLATAAERASVGYILPRDCYPNGLWKEATGATWRIMDSSYFFTPNLSFGSMTFTQAKVIDIAWDLLIGRGGQLLLAYVNYRVFNEWLVYHMEMHRTSYKMYTAIAFETTSLGTLGVLGNEFLVVRKGWSWRHFFRWLAVLSMLISTLYVLAFPTLMAAMTGYLTTYAAYVEDYKGDLIEWGKVKTVWAIVEDSVRIGNYTAPLVVTTEDTYFTNALMSYMKEYGNGYGLDYPSINTSTPYPIPRTFCRNLTSTFTLSSNATSLPAPTLNITWATYYSTSPVPGRAEHGYHSGGLPGYFYSLSSDRQGDVYTADYILAHGACKPSDTYQWGFSYIFLFMVSIFNFVWACIMVGMWGDTQRGSRMYRAGRRPGLLTSVVELARVVREEIARGDAEGMQENELRRALRESGGMLVVPKGEFRIGRTDGSLRERRSWLTKGSTF